MKLFKDVEPESVFFSDTDAIANLNPSIKCKVFRTLSKFQPKNLGGTVACWWIVSYVVSKGRHYYYCIIAQPYIE